ncbi:MAG: DNA topoisomerase 1 [Chlamydiae bacterium]|nr:DNA topoisomerase 1 [Chlamydiota bacterium]
MLNQSVFHSAVFSKTSNPKERMKKPLIIVESPTKIKTIQKFLGNKYAIESSVGHIRDLPSKSFAIDFENNFEPSYEVLPDKKAVVDKLKKAAKNADVVYLAPDPDREGEAIAWHIAHVLPKGTKLKRITFTSITKNAVSQALENPREINMSLVDAQQARRLLDRIVGYKISPILSRRIHRKVGGALSGGRVQSVALKLVVDREKEIDGFKPVEYWTLKGLLNNKKDSFEAYLHSIDHKRITKEAEEGKKTIQINNQEKADQIVKELEQSSYKITSVTAKERKRNPVPPFITSTLQQEASRHYGFNSVRTMSVAQSLYEGVEVGEGGSVGLITYMRTDSVRIAPEGIQEVRSYIEQKYGKKFLHESVRSYSTKKSAQDAHEAIRPTSLEHSPEMIRNFLNREQFLLYDLIWKRFVASQMASAIYDTISCDIHGSLKSSPDKYLLRATGSILKFKGFLSVYEEKVDEESIQDKDRLLPSLKEGQDLDLEKILSEQSFTKPPPRYTEALLIKALEKSGIGRPSTYASIMNKIQSREYTVRERSRLVPTELGKVIAQMLETNFKQIMNIGFTAALEDELELVAVNEKDWKKLLAEFWKDFQPTVEQAEKEAFVPKILTEDECPKCGDKLLKIWAKSKYFYGCSNYPTCDFSAPIELLTLNKEDYAPNFDWEQKCPKCTKEMVVRQGRFGMFLGCSDYPNCKGIVNIPKKGEDLPDESQMPFCPAESCDGKIVARRSRYGKIFFSCSNFPECDVIVNDLEDLKVKYINYPKQAYIKKTKPKKGAKTAKKSAKTAKGKKKAAKTATKREQPKVKLSKELSDLIGEGEFSRGEVTKKIWIYIKEHDLQDPSNKRMIVPDQKLSQVLGKDPIDMFQMTRVVSGHLKN